MIESCMLTDPTATCPYSERPMISFRYTKSMKGSPPPPIAFGWPSAQSPRRLASALSAAMRPLARRAATSVPGPRTPCVASSPRAFAAA